MQDFLAASAQTGMPLAFHIIFACVGVAMPLLMAIAEWRYLKTGDEVYYTLARRWAVDTAIMFAGVAASPLERYLRAPIDKAGRVLVNSDLSVPKALEIFVVGDSAAVTSDGKPVPGVATAAVQEGRHAARNIIRIVRGEPVQPFHYVDKGTLASIGRAAAVAETEGSRLSGFIAWVVWLGVRIYYLIGFRRRFIVMAEWAWLYLRNERGARLITGDVESLLARRSHQPQPTVLGEIMGKDGSQVGAKSVTG